MGGLLESILGQIPDPDGPIGKNQNRFGSAQPALKRFGIQLLFQCLNTLACGHITALGPMQPGSISYQYQVCGKKGCKCQDPDEPRRHGPYCKLFYVHRGKKVRRFVRADCVDQIKTRLQAYKTFRKLTDRWIELSIKRAQAEFFPGGKRQ